MYFSLQNTINLVQKLREMVHRGTQNTLGDCSLDTLLILYYISTHLVNNLPVKNCLIQADTLSTIPFNFALEYVIRSVHANQDGLKLSGTHQLLGYTDDINILGGSVNTIRGSAGALVVANKETGLEVNADKTKYMVMSRNQDSGRSHNMKTDNNSFGRMEELKVWKQP